MSCAAIRRSNDLPYKIELNAWGKIEMSPASNRHGRLQGELAFQLRRQLAGGVVIYRMLDLHHAWVSGCRMSPGLPRRS